MPGVPRVGRDAHWHTVERAGSAAKAHQQMTLRDGRRCEVSARRPLQSFDNGPINNFQTVV